MLEAPEKNPVIEQSLPKLEDQPIEIQNKIKAIQRIQQRMPHNFLRPKLKDQCEICKGTEGLQRHHIKYEPIEETITVCWKCHSLIHGRDLGIKNNLKKETQTDKWRRQKRAQREKKRIEQGISEPYHNPYYKLPKGKAPNLNYIS